MQRLCDIQREFARGVLLGDTGAIAPHILGGAVSAADRLAIHRNTSRAIMIEALRLTFPAVDSLVGHDFFAMAAARFLRLNPPVSACLDDHGAAFPDFLGAMPETASLPYLADVGRYEWALSVAAHAPDVPALDLSALMRLEPSMHDAVRFVAHPSVTLLNLQCPADAIADAALSGDERSMASIDPGEKAIWLIVHRGRSGIEAERLTPATHDFLSRLFAGEPLGVLLVSATQDAAAILAGQFTQGRLIGFSTTSAQPAQETVQ